MWSQPRNPLEWTREKQPLPYGFLVSTELHWLQVSCLWPLPCHHNLKQVDDFCIEKALSPALSAEVGHLVTWPTLGHEHKAWSLCLSSFLSFLKKIYLFFKISGCAGSLLIHAGFLCCSERGRFSSCGVRASHCGGVSCCGSQALEHRLNSCGAPA